jgi:hypothetical protein
LIETSVSLKRIERAREQGWKLERIFAEDKLSEGGTL